MNRLYILVVVMAAFLISCDKDDPIENGNDTKEPTGKIQIHFIHNVDGDPLVTHSMQYTNAAGNEYEIDEVQWFISDVFLHREDGTFYRIEGWKDIHYVDIDIPSTLKWQVFDDIPAGDYSGISFTFGLNEAQNESFKFVNPPESFMFWPTVLGGGYHYLKLNGKWKDTVGATRFFNFHLGIGQEITATDTTYIHNHFEVDFDTSNFTLQEGEKKDVYITMNIENWFKNPHIYDHNVWGGDIMENQAAMAVASENGHDVFSLSFGCCDE